MVLQFDNTIVLQRVVAVGTTPLTGERAQAILRGRPRGRLGTAGSGNGCLRGRPRGRFGPVGSDPAFLRDRLDCLGSIQGALLRPHLTRKLMYLSLVRRLPYLPHRTGWHRSRTAFV